MYTSLLKLGQEHVSLAVNVLSDSFMDNPMLIYLFPWINIRKKVLPIAFKAVVMRVVNKGEIYATSDKMEGILWIERKGHATPDLVKALIKATKHTYPQLLPFLLKRVAKIKKIGIAINKYYHKPHNFVRISIIAVGKEHRGKKLMSKMIGAVFNEVENTNIYCLVETETESNVQIYQHLGFRLVEIIEEVTGKLYFYILVYDPHFLV
ncbi:MAG: GNAT family N-acetyltransferase [Dehalobacterium sp.]